MVLHIKFFNVPPDKRKEARELIKERKKRIEETEDVEFLGLFYPRGSGYMFAHITRYPSYAAWEEFWKSPGITNERRKGDPISLVEMDMFFDEIDLD